MHAILRLATFLCAALYARAVVLSASGVYTLTLGSQALVHASKNAPTITAAPIDPNASNQVWTVVVNLTSSLATVQNVNTFSFMALAFDASGVPSVVPSASPFSWITVPSNGGNKSMILLPYSSAHLLMLAPA